MPSHHFYFTIFYKSQFLCWSYCLVVSEAWVTWRVESSIQLGSHTGPAAADQPSHPKLIAAAPIASNSDIDVRQYSWTPSCLSLTGGTLRSVRALQTYGPISGRGCLLDEPASQWEARIYIHVHNLFFWCNHNIPELLIFTYSATPHLWASFPFFHAAAAVPFALFSNCRSALSQGNMSWGNFSTQTILFCLQHFVHILLRESRNDPISIIGTATYTLRTAGLWS